MSTTATYRLPASLAQARALDLRVIAAMIAATAWLASSITSQSLWIDEGVTAWFASQPSLQAMVHSVLAMKKTSDPQMPGYWFYIWTWCHAFGTSEVALRAANIPFAAIIAASFLTFSRRVLDSWWGCVPVVFSPFLAFYMNEARPYVAVMAMTSVAAVAAYLYFSEPTEAGSRNAWVASIAIFIACFLHMLSVFVLIALACFALLRPRSANLSLRPFLAPLLTVGPLLCLLGSYYFWTVLRGSAGAIASPGIKNLAFVFYEFAGLGGLGPSRNELRDGSTWQLIAAHAPWLLCGVLPGVILVLIFCRHEKSSKTDKASIELVGGCLVGIALFLVAAQIAHFRFVGRHLAGFFPILFLIALSFVAKKIERPRLLALLCIAISATWFWSDLRLRLSPEYQKDDYRTAAQVANAYLPEGTVVWVADPYTAQYYQLPTDDPCCSPQQRIPHAHVAVNWTRSQVERFLSAGRTHALTVILSKPDLYDVDRAWTQKLAASATKTRSFAAFEVWQYSPAKAQAK